MIFVFQKIKEVFKKINSDMIFGSENNGDLKNKFKSAFQFRKRMEI